MRSKSPTIREALKARALTLGEAFCLPFFVAFFVFHTCTQSNIGGTACNISPQALDSRGIYITRSLGIAGLKVFKSLLFPNNYPTNDLLSFCLTKNKTPVTTRDTGVRLVGTTEFESVTSCMSSKHSNQLSYAPKQLSHYTTKWTGLSRVNFQL